MEEYIYTNKKINTINKKNNRKTKNNIKIIKIIIIILIITLIITGIIIFLKEKHEKYLYSLTYEYKLSAHGYELETVKILEEKLNNEQLDNLLTKTKIDKIKDIVSSDKFMFKNLDRYVLNFDYTDHSFDINKMINKVNVNKDITPFIDSKPVDLTKEYKILVNGYYKLNENYKPNNLVRIGNKYCFTEMYAEKETYEAYKKMYEAALNDGIKFLITSAYRSYTHQNQVFEDYKKNKGESYAKKFVAVPGHSEHQTGLALDIFTYGSTMATFENTEGYKWLKDNSYKYGFILRYSKDVESLMGTTFESWHYRYVGVEVATKIYNENLTFEEYYAYYVEE